MDEERARKRVALDIAMRWILGFLCHDTLGSKLAGRTLRHEAS
jgi:hypothetical protein